jgi:hypothetical protein
MLRIQVGAFLIGRDEPAVLLLGRSVEARRNLLNDAFNVTDDRGQQVVVVQIKLLSDGVGTAS